MLMRSKREFQIDDEAFTKNLPGIWKQKHERWKDKMLLRIDGVALDLERGMQAEEVMRKWKLTLRDMGLFITLKFFTDDEIERFGLKRFLADPDD